MRPRLLASLTANETYTQTASSVLAPQGNIDIAAKQVLIDAARDASSGTSHDSYSKTALGGSVSVPLLNALQGAASNLQAAGKTSDPRMKALAGLNAALQASDALEAGQKLASGNLGGIKVSISISNTQRENTTEQSASTAVGSQLAAGGNVNIRAIGADKASTLDVIGSDIQAGAKASLKADGTINLQAAQSTSEQHSKNSSSGASLGIGFAMRGQQNGFTLDVSASKGRGHGDGSDTTQLNTHVSGQQVDLQSSGDTTLKGRRAQGRPGHRQPRRSKPTALFWGLMALCATLLNGLAVHLRAQATPHSQTRFALPLRLRCFPNRLATGA